MRKYGLKKIKHHDSVLRTSVSRVACLFKGAMSRLYIFSILPITRVPNRFFGIRDFPYLKLGIRDFEANSRQDSGVKVCARLMMPEITLRITESDESLGRDYGIEEPYWGPKITCPYTLWNSRNYFGVLWITKSQLLVKIENEVWKNVMLISSKSCNSNPSYLFKDCPSVTYSPFSVQSISSSFVLRSCFHFCFKLAAVPNTWILINFITQLL